MPQIIITQTKSIIDRPERQKLTMKALGLGKINKSVTVEDSPQILGMIQKVQHLIEVKNS
jgi:large subunit ribosomal protein L30